MACIFLSYRKKDRFHANELMKLIHKNPTFRDIAIWYDEFLVPGENFDENIEQALQKSDLIALLVTPNLLNENNYVRDVEYKKAVELQKSILPVEMVPVDQEELVRQFVGIPACVRPHDGALLGEGIRKCLESASFTKPTVGAEHDYLIGLAYCEGIDVERDQVYGLTRIQSAGEAGHPEAMEWLFNKYSGPYYDESSGTFEDACAVKAYKWAKKLYQHHAALHGEMFSETMKYMRLTISWGMATAVGLSDMCERNRVFADCLRLAEKEFSLHTNSPNGLSGYVDDDAFAIVLSINSLILMCDDVKLRRSALAFLCKVFEAQREYGRDENYTVSILDFVAKAYEETGNFEKAYRIRCKIAENNYQADTGEKARYNSLRYLEEITENAIFFLPEKQVISAYQNIVKKHIETYGNASPQTLRALSLLAKAYLDFGEHEMLVSLQEHLRAEIKKLFSSDGCEVHPKV